MGDGESLEGEVDVGEAWEGWVEWWWDGGEGEEAARVVGWLGEV
jgi:hypothetical protein